MKRLVSTVLFITMFLTANFTCFGAEIFTLQSSEDTEIFLKDALVTIIGNNKGLVNGEKTQLDKTQKACTFIENSTIYLPAEFLANGLGGKYEWHEESKTAYLNLGYCVLQGSPNKASYMINGKKYFIQSPIIMKDDIIYFPDEIVKKGLKKHIYQGEGGIICISDKEILIDSDKESDILAEISAKISYERPTQEKILEDLLKTNPNKQHPRIMITPDKPNQFRTLAETDPLYSRWVKNAIAGADAALTQSTATYTLVNGQLLQQSRAVLGILQRLSMGYILTGEQKYVDRAWKEIENASNFPSWNQKHFLDVGELSAAFAIAYDWMYDAFTPQQRKVIRKTLCDKAFYPALDAYRQTGPKLPSTQCQWIYSDTNWNAVCNGGIGMAAMAVADEEDVQKEALECIAGGIKSVEHMLKAFAPDGAWFEGVGYWVYTIQYLVMYMSSMDTALGTDYGTFNSPGVKETAYFPVYMMGPNSMFSFGDSGSSAVDVPEWNYFANKLNDPAIADRRLKQLEKGGGSFKDMIWYNPDMQTENVALTKDKYFGGKAEIVTMRSSWDDRDALFFGTRGGNSRVNHGHIDIGSFTLDANGINWAMDLGGDDYGLDEYFGSKRFEYYRLRGESHNMLVINPSLQPELCPSNTDLKLKSKERGAIVTMDMTGAHYSEQGVEKAIRAMGLVDNRTKFIVQDEVKTSKPSEMYWFMHTDAAITISEDGKEAILEKDGQKLHAQIMAPQEGVFTVMDDKPLPTSPQHKGQKFYDKVKKLTIHLTEQSETTVSVVMTPLKSGENIPETKYEFLPISQWEIPDGNIPELSSISIDGEPISDFTPSVYSYTKYYENAQSTAPIVTATGDYDIEVTQASSVPGSAVINMKENGKSIKKYYINFNLQPTIGVISGKDKYNVLSVMASDTPEAVNLPENVVDNDLDTKWAAQGDQWLMFDLGKKQQIDTVAISWLQPSQRISPFEIQVSNDMKEWKQVYKGKSLGVSSDFDNYSFDKTETQYVKINFHGSNANTWNSIMEVGILGDKKK